MTNHFLERCLAGATIAAIGCLGLSGQAAAQVTYARPAPLDPFFSPYDETYGTSPSFEIYPRGNDDGPAVRVVARCQYPDGWNVTDFSRDVNGIPAGVDHVCRDHVGGRVRARY